MANGAYILSKNIVKTELKELFSDKYLQGTKLARECNFNEEVPVIISGNTILIDTEVPIYYCVFNNCKEGGLVKPVNKIPRDLYINLPDDVSLWLVKIIKFCVEMAKDGKNDKWSVACMLDSYIESNDTEMIEGYADHVYDVYVKRFNDTVNVPFMQYLQSQGFTKLSNQFAARNPYERGIWFMNTKENTLWDIGDILEKYSLVRQKNGFFDRLFN